VLGRKHYESDVCESNPDKLEKLAFELEDSIVLRVRAISVIAQRVWVEWVFKASSNRC
jgi:hypothetical protein